MQMMSSFFNRLMERYTPDPFVLALLITGVVIAGAMGLTPVTFDQVVVYWGQGFWKLLEFTLQMAMILVGGSVVASSPAVDRFLARLIQSIKTPSGAAVITAIISTVGCWVNWGFGLVAGAIVAKKIIESHPTFNFKLLVAAAYSGFLVWHGGCSGSIPLLMATPGNFSEALMGGVIPVSQTILSPFNLWLSLCVGIVVIGTSYFLSKTHDERPIKLKMNQPDSALETETKTPAEVLETSRFLTFLSVLLAAAYIICALFQGVFRFDLNAMSFIFLFLGFVLHQTPRRFIKAVNEASGRVGPILLQFPFYAGIMGIMSHSGLTEVMSAWFVDISSPQTFHLLTFYSAGLLNLFIPSGGGQWAVQGPIMIEAARAMGVDTVRTAMAIAWGDAWTNMMQPFWALPILAIAGLHLRDMIGYCIIVMITSGIVITLFFCAF